MRLTVPPLEIGEDEGFSDEKDIFRRKGFGERLANLIEKTDGELVIALDAPWGEGKSTFIKMWRGHLKQKDNGVHKIYHSIDKQTEKSIFEQKVLSAVKTGGSIGLDLLARTLSGGALSGEILEGHAKKLIGDRTADAMDNMDKYVSHSLKSVSANKIAIRGFKEYLETLPQKLSYNGKSIVFIIDELDRCKPPFALEIVEIVKHLFAVPNITFALVMNRSQLEASVRNEYGTADASKYLQKFINLWVSLPKAKEGYDHDTRTYLSHCIKRMGMEPVNQNQQNLLGMFDELIIYYNVSLREIERCMTNLAFIRANQNENLNHHYQWITAYLSIIKVIYPTVYSQLCTSQIDYPTLVKNTKLDELQKNWTHTGQSTESHYLKWLLRYYLADDEQARVMLSEGNHLGSMIFSDGRTAIKDVCKWLDSFRTN